MQFSVQSADPKKNKTDCYVIGVFANSHLPKTAQQLDKISDGYLNQFLQRGDWPNECGQTLLLHNVPNLPMARILLVGCGKEENFTEAMFRKMLVTSVNALRPTGTRNATYYLHDLVVNKRTLHWKIRQAIELIAGALYVFDQFKTVKKAPAISLQEVIFHVDKSAELQQAERAICEGKAIVHGMQFTKDLGNLPANICTPTYLAEQAQRLAQDYKAIKIKVFDEKQIKKLGMRTFLSVAQGSLEPPKLIVAEYHGGSVKQQPIVLVGKGITFDSGGISLKSPGGMEEMKFDMCGAATVLGVLKAVAELALPIRVVGVMPTTENMPANRATRPGDIVTSMSGQTVEILNTDAEGRLILCDALTYSERFSPAAVIDIASLTGAITTTLGYVASGVMGNNEPLVSILQKAGDYCGDRVWPLPLWEEYQDLINSNVADIANTGDGPYAKSIVAGCFLGRFAKKFPWAHLDVAATAWKLGRDKAATGRPVPLLVQYLIDYK